MSKLKSWAKKLQVGRAKKARAMATLSQFRHRSPSPVYGRGRSRPPCILNVLDADGESNTSQGRKSAAAYLRILFKHSENNKVPGLNLNCQINSRLSDNLARVLHNEVGGPSGLGIPLTLIGA